MDGEVSPVVGCRGCEGTGGIMSCPTHGGIRITQAQEFVYAPMPPISIKHGVFIPYEMLDKLIALWRERDFQEVGEELSRWRS